MTRAILADHAGQIYVPKADLTKVEKKLATLQGREKKQKDTQAEEARELLEAELRRSKNENYWLRWKNRALALVMLVLALVVLVVLWEIHRERLILLFKQTLRIV
jgi:hypothetical protein